jgi:hypothetical protein
MTFGAGLKVTSVKDLYLHTRDDDSKPYQKAMKKFLTKDKFGRIHAAFGGRLGELDWNNVAKLLTVDFSSAITLGTWLVWL